MRRYFYRPATFAWSFALMSLSAAAAFSATNLPQQTLPQDVWFKGNQQSFNSVYYAALQQGQIWIKPNRDSTGIDGPWQKIVLPAALEGRVTEIAFDDEHLLALNEQRELFTLWHGLDSPDKFRWQKAWGLPFWQGPGIKLPTEFTKWDFSVVSPRLDRYYVDPAGHHLPIGVAKVSHIIAVKPGGRNISYNDPWLPVDWSYEICGPERGRFEINAASASGSTTFVMGRFGDMFTRIYDFDLSGHDDLIKYSYQDLTQVKQIPNLPQPLYVLLNATQLPAFPWVKQPKISGRITDRLSIHKIGIGVTERMLRVEGWNAAGESGFYQKRMTQTDSHDWRFHVTGEPVRGAEVFNPLDDMSQQQLLPSEDRRYFREAKSGRIARWKNQDWSASLTEVNRYCSPATLTLRDRDGNTLPLILHQIEKIRIKRSERGIGKRALRQGGALEVPIERWAARENLSPHLLFLLNHYFKDQRIIDVKVMLSEDRVVIKRQGLQWAFAADNK